MPSWLPLLNYSTKYNISLSTLRRRIKAKTIEFKLDQGKYMILDQSAPTPKAAKPEESPKKVLTSVTSPETVEMAHPSFVEASVLTSANRLVEEIKAAYTKILQEKEEQISQLKEELVDLRMLVRILEEKSTTPFVQPEKQSGAVETAPDDDYLFSDFQNREV